MKVLHVNTAQAVEDHEDTTQRLSSALLWIFSLILYTSLYDRVKGIYQRIPVLHVILTKIVEILFVSLRAKKGAFILPTSNCCAHTVTVKIQKGLKVELQR